MVHLLELNVLEAVHSLPMSLQAVHNLFVLWPCLYYRLAKGEESNHSNSLRKFQESLHAAKGEDKRDDTVEHQQVQY